MINLKNHDKEKQKLSFVTDMDISLANAIRRSVLEIPVMAIDEVEIIKNDSALYDEIVAHRIGLVPIKTDKGLKEVKFSLKEKGPKTVVSSDIKPDVGNGMELPIVLLEDGQEIEMVCDARAGKGVEHIKYSPGLVFYKHNLDDDVIDFVNINENGEVSFDEKELDLKGLSEEYKKKIESVKECKELLFNIESWGQMDVKDIFINAVDVLDDNLKEVAKGVK